MVDSTGGRSGLKFRFFRLLFAIMLFVSILGAANSDSPTSYYYGAAGVVAVLWGGYLYRDIVRETPGESRGRARSRVLLTVAFACFFVASAVGIALAADRSSIVLQVAVASLIVVSAASGALAVIFRLSAASDAAHQDYLSDHRSPGSSSGSQSPQA